MATELPRFHTGLPILRASKNTVVHRVIRWNLFNNEPHLLSFDWLPRHQAPPTEVDDGTIYTHIDGVRLHCVMSFAYWHESYRMDDLHAPDRGFTEIDYQYLMAAQIGTTIDLEFFPYESMVEPNRSVPDVRFLCHIRQFSRHDDENNAWRWACLLDVEGVNIVESADIPV